MMMVMVAVVNDSNNKQWRHGDRGVGGEMHTFVLNDRQISFNFFFFRSRVHSMTENFLIFKFKSSFEQHADSLGPIHSKSQNMKKKTFFIVYLYVCSLFLSSCHSFTHSHIKRQASKQKKKKERTTAIEKKKRKSD